MTNATADEVDTKSTNEHVCVVLNDTIKSKKEEISFLESVGELFEEKTNVNPEVNKLIADSKKYISTIGTIKTKTNCCGNK